MALAVWGSALPALGATIEIHPGQSFETAVESLRPGDQLIVHAGTYSDSGRIGIAVRGTEAAPVLIAGAAGGDRPHITRSSSVSIQNTVNVEGATYLTIRNLEISGNGGDGINLNGGPSHITLEDLDIHDVDVGVNFRSDMHHITVRRTHIHRTGANGGTGEGMYVGCNYATCSVHDSIIENNWIHDTFAATQGDGIEIKRGSHSNTIRNNVIHDTRWPCILLYGTEGNPRNIVEGNALWNCGDSGIQAAADAVVRNNLILRSPSNGFNSQDHQGVTPKDLEFVHNTVIGGNPCLRLHDWSNKQGLVFANNAIYCESGNFVISGLSQVTVLGNVMFPATSQIPASGYRAGRSVEADFVNAGSLDVYPSSDSVMIDAGHDTFATVADFNFNSRTGTPDAGAYTWTAPSNPGWDVAPGFKDASAGTNVPVPPENLRVESDE